MRRAESSVPVDSRRFPDRTGVGETHPVGPRSPAPRPRAGRRPATAGREPLRQDASWRDRVQRTDWETRDKRGVGEGGGRAEPRP